MITIQRQLELLWQHVLTDANRPRSVVEVARTAGVTEQTLLNLLHGRAHDPRLQTLHGIIVSFGISLDYFNLRSEAECLAYLAQRGLLGAAPDIIQQIDTHAQSLNSEKARNVLTMLEWRVLAAKTLSL